MREDREAPHYASPPILALAQSDRKANSPLRSRTGSQQTNAYMDTGRPKDMLHAYTMWTRSCTVVQDGPYRIYR